jgi:hypothetical protein
MRLHLRQQWRSVVTFSEILALSIEASSTSKVVEVAQLEVAAVEVD